MEIAGEVVAAMPTAASRWAMRWSPARGWAGSPNWSRSMRASVRAKPANLDFAHAASVGAAYNTAYVALVRLANVQPGEWVVVHGATGGVGLAAVDLAKALGCRVIATSRSADKLAVVAREYAPDATLPAPGFREAVKELDRRRRGRDLRSCRRRRVRRKHALHRASAGGCWWSASPRAGSRASRPTFR